MIEHFSNNPKRIFPGLWTGLFAALIILGAGLFIYRAIIFPLPGMTGSYPWGSDTLGHVFRAEYLRSTLQQGKLIPEIYPNWYMGIQLLRYYPPLPYYVLVGLAIFLGNSITAASWFILLTAWLGSIGWLLYRRWLGWPLALAGGILYLYLPDNLRVALGEGNLPRALASAFLPYLFYFLLRIFEEDGAIRHAFSVGLLISLTVLAHAMMAAIYAVCCVGIISLLSIFRVSSTRRFVLSLGFVFLGLATTSFWLLPSLTGGITDLDPSAVAEAITAVPLAEYFNPATRTHNPESIYIGAALLAAVFVCILFMIKSRSYHPHSIIFIVTGLCGVAITLPGVLELFNTLPLHNLLWPVRFLGVASFCLLLGLLWWLKSIPRARWLALPLLVLIALDGAGSLHLIHMRLEKPDLKAIVAEISRQPGWREATLDYSQIGSEAAYELATMSGREQVFGWAYQGAYVARTVAMLNESIEYGRLTYLIDRLNLYGVDDVLLLKDMDSAGRMRQDLTEDGFELVYRGVMSDLYHRDGKPRAVVADWLALGIGTTISPYAYLFPQIVTGTSPYIDDYRPEDLRRFPILVLSGFAWHDQRKAESLVQFAARAGVRIVVDLTGVPQDPLARIPNFLGVWGEHVVLDNQPVEITTGIEETQLMSFDSQGQPWHTLTPQGVDRYLITSQFLGEKATVAGVRSIGDAEVTFLGYNLAYHALQAADFAAEQILADLIGLQVGRLNDYTYIPLFDYQAHSDGYRFDYETDQEETLFLPVACLDGMSVNVDGRVVEISSYEKLLAFKAPAGRHHVDVTVQSGFIHKLGWVISGLACLIYGILFVRIHRW